MKPWTQLDAAPIPGGGTLKLMRRGEDEFVVGAVLLRAGRGLQRVFEFVDGFLVPNPLQ